MEIPCPKCGEMVVVSGLGRKPLNISVKIVCDVLQAHHSVKVAAEYLNCSPGYIFKVLKANRLTLKKVRENHL